jgi:hypothetical protein
MTRNEDPLGDGLATIIIAITLTFVVLAAFGLGDLMSERPFMSEKSEASVLQTQTEDIQASQQ